MKRRIHTSKYASISLIACLISLVAMLLFSQKVSATTLLVRSDRMREDTVAASPTATSNGTDLTYQGSLSAQGDPNNSSSARLAWVSTLWSLIMITLVDISAIFWAGAQLWYIFVFSFLETTDKVQKTICQQAEQRFTNHFAIPVLCVFFFANIGILIGQTLSITHEQWIPALNPLLLIHLVTQGHSGTYWIAREVLCVGAFTLILADRFTKGRLPWLKDCILWLQFVFALFLLAAITLSGDTTATNNDTIVFAVLIDFLHLTAASLWIGGMVYISAIYVPVLKRYPMMTRTRSLLTVLPHYSPLVFVGVGVMVISGPLNTTVRMPSANQLLSTLYGRTLLVKVLVVAVLLVTSALHVLLLRPRLARSLKEYDRGTQTVQIEIEAGQQDDVPEVRQKPIADARRKVMERSIGRQTWTLSHVLRWEPVLGILVLVCTSLLAVFSGTLQPATPPVPTSQAATQPPTVPTKPLITTIKTKDQKFQVKLSVTPNTFGTNTFTTTILNAAGNVVPSSQIHVALYTTMLDMDMGTDSVNLQPDGKGHFSAQGDLGMGGNWQIRIEIRTADATLHSATVQLYTPF